MTSDASFPFGGPEPEAAPVKNEEGGSRRNLLLGGALGVAVLGAAGFLFLGGGGAEDEAFVVPSSRQAAAAPQAAAPAPVEVVPAAATEQIGRNPFKPRYVEPKAVAAPAAPAQPTAQPTVAPTSLPLPQQPVQVVVAQPAPTQAPAEYPITFVSTSEAGGAKTYTWRLDGAKETVTVLQGQRFGKYGELVVLTTATSETGALEAVLQVGDSSPVRVKLDETIKVL